MRPIEQLLRLALCQNGMLWILRRMTHRRRVVHEVMSPVSGLVRVVDCGRERCLELAGGCHSFAFTRGSWREVHREYWGHLHRPQSGAPPERVLMCGLGGGTALHVMRRRAPQCELAVIEHDPEIVATAEQWFGIAELDRLAIHLGDIDACVAALAAAPARFDLVVEDATFLPTRTDRERALAVTDRLADLLAAHGTLVLNAPLENRQDRARAAAFVAALEQRGFEVSSTTIRQRWCNRILYCRRLPRA